MSKKGLTMIEIMVSVIILALVVAGMANLFISGKRWVLISQTRMTTGELGRFFLDPLQMLVRQDTWATNCLGQGNCPSVSRGIADGLDRDYTATYTINNNQPIANLTRVRVDINFNVQP